MSEQLPPEPPVYHVDDETKDYLISLVENSQAVAKLQMDEESARDIIELCDEICDRFDLISDTTHYDVETLDNGDILWRLQQPQEPKEKPKHLRKVWDSESNVTPLRPNNDSDS
jgi:hypothetical protein